MPNHKLKVPPHGGAKHARRSRRDQAAAVMPLAQAAAAAARPQPEGQENSGVAVAGAAAAAAAAAAVNLQGNGVQNNVAYASAGPADQVDPDSEIRDDELEEPSEVRHSQGSCIVL